MSKLWSGRFDQDITSSVLEYTYTTDIDSRLTRFDLWGSMAHVLMLCYQHIISEEHGRVILRSLLAMFHQEQQGEFSLDKNLEDVHFNIEQLLIAKVGAEIGGKLHTARSRNDQVVTDTRLYLREVLLDLQRELFLFVESLLKEAEKHIETIAVGYTHTQGAQPISLGYWLTGYASILCRDIQRLSAAYENTDHNPLGACALAGTSFPIDRQLTTKLLGFHDILLHSLDATSSRDFILESAAALAILMSNLSRCAEEIVLWSSFEFGLIEVNDAYATGSSIMPQKKNPVVAELARGRTGRVYGALTSLLTMSKGLPLGYSCDLQEDKPPIWQALDVTLSTVAIMREQFQALTFHSTRATEICWKNFSTATELANYLVAEKQFSFRHAHHVVGELVKTLISEGKSLADLTTVTHMMEQMGTPIDTNTLGEILSPAEVMKRQRSQGGTAPKSVLHIINSIGANLAQQMEAHDRRRTALQEASENTLQAVERFINGVDIAVIMEEYR